MPVPEEAKDISACCCTVGILFLMCLAISLFLTMLFT